MIKISEKARININLTKVNTRPVYRPVKTTYNHAQLMPKLKGLYELLMTRALGIILYTVFTVQFVSRDIPAKPNN
jgi:hypothetical protein